MSSSPRAAIVGVAESDLGRTPDKTVLQLQAQAARAALDDAGLAFSDIDALFCAGNWAWSPGLMLAEYLGLKPRYTDTTNIGGSSFEAHIEHAVAGIEAGLFNVALITYGSTQRSDRSRNRGNVSFKLTEQYEPPFGLPTPVGAYALAAMRHMFEYGTTSEQLAEVAVATRKWAAMFSNRPNKTILRWGPGSAGCSACPLSTLVTARIAPSNTATAERA
jgi:acetyl-CoA acetyltransferase